MNVTVPSPVFGGSPGIDVASRPLEQHPLITRRPRPRATEQQTTTVMYSLTTISWRERQQVPMSTDAHILHTPTRDDGHLKSSKRQGPQSQGPHSQGPQSGQRGVTPDPVWNPTKRITWIRHDTQCQRLAKRHTKQGQDRGGKPAPSRTQRHRFARQDIREQLSSMSEIIE